MIRPSFLPMTDSNHNPTITAIIPTYERSKLLKRAIKSIQNQTYKNLIIAVFDNASKDDTAQVVSEFASKDSRIKYFQREKNLGPFLNYALAVQAVETEYFSLMADDDVLLPDFYEKVVEGLKRCDFKAKIVITNVLKIDSDFNAISSKMNRYPQGFYDVMKGFDFMLQNTPPTWTGMLFDTEAVHSVGGLDASIGHPFDFEFEYRMVRNFPYQAIDAIGAIYCVYPEHKSAPLEALYSPEGYLRYFNKLKAGFGSETKLSLNIGKKKQSHYKRRICKQALLNLSQNRFEHPRAALEAIKLHGKGKYFYKLYFWLILSTYFSIAQKALQWIRAYSKSHKKSTRNHSDLNIKYQEQINYLKNFEIENKR